MVNSRGERYQSLIVLLFSSIIAATRRARALAAITAAAAVVAGCGGVDERGDREDPTVDAAASSEDAGVRRDSSVLVDGARVAPTLGCDAEGSGELVVQLQLAPNVDASDVWLSAVCGRTINAGASDEKPLRLVRVARGETTVRLRGLGDGYYRVITSALGAPSGASGVAPIRGGASEVTFVSVSATEVPSWSFDVSTGQRTADAGAAPTPGRDAGAADSGAPDASGSIAAPSIEFDATAAGAVAGRIGLILTPREAGWQDVTFSLANMCESGVCAVLRATGIELRVERDGLPTALVSIALGASGRGMSIAPSESFSTESRIVPVNAFAPGARVRLSLFGAPAL